MDSIRSTLDELTQVFNTRMNEFHKELKSSIPAASPTSNINSQFNAFRSFVLTALENLKLQVELLSKQQDDLEMRSRRKTLLLHGVSEVDKEDTAFCGSKLLCEHLKLSQATSSSFSLCHRLGRPNKEKPRAILIKFKEVSLRNLVWSSKTQFKGSGVTVSEFLTKKRHKVFVAARQHFGVTKTWTRDGIIVIMGADGSKHRVTTMPELDAVTSSASFASVTPAVSADLEVVKPIKTTITRLKRAVKK